jgi:hypothetical protein
LASASKIHHSTVGGGQIVLMTDLLKDIFAELKLRSIRTNSIPEQLPILRTLQIVAHYGRKFCPMLCDTHQ